MPGTPKNRIRIQKNTQKGKCNSKERKIIYQLKIAQESNGLPHNEGSLHSSDTCPGKAG